MSQKQTKLTQFLLNYFKNSHQIIHSLLPKGESRNEGNAVSNRQLDEPLSLFQHQPDANINEEKNTK